MCVDVKKVIETGNEFYLYRTPYRCVLQFNMSTSKNSFQSVCNIVMKEHNIGAMVLLVSMLVFPIFVV